MHHFPDFSRRACAGQYRLRRCGEAAEQCSGRLALSLIQVGVPRTHCETVMLPYSRTDDDLGVEVQVFYEPLNHYALLEVLLAEICPCGARDVQQLRDNRRDP